jgi:hypothetical protein
MVVLLGLLPNLERDASVLVPAVGFLLVSGMAQHNVPLSTAVVTVIVLIAIAANTLMLRLGKRITHRSK